MNPKALFGSVKLTKRAVKSPFTKRDIILDGPTKMLILASSKEMKP